MRLLLDGVSEPAIAQGKLVWPLDEATAKSTPQSSSTARGLGGSLRAFAAVSLLVAENCPTLYTPYPMPKASVTIRVRANHLVGSNLDGHPTRSKRCAIIYRKCEAARRRISYYLNRENARKTIRTRIACRCSRPFFGSDALPCSAKLCAATQHAMHRVPHRVPAA
jgi:hypothetical protein